MLKLMLRCLYASCYQLKDTDCQLDVDIRKNNGIALEACTVGRAIKLEAHVSTFMCMMLLMSVRQ